LRRNRLGQDDADPKILLGMGRAEAGVICHGFFHVRRHANEEPNQQYVVAGGVPEGDAA
jgi:hypothetical protein